MEKNGINLEIIDNPKSLISEAFRVLRTNLQFSSVDKPVKKICVTSSRPKEGKSMVVSNLALSVASTGRKVLLIDGDLRKPSIQTIFHLKNDKGLSNLLVENISYELVLNSSGISNLHIITSGSIPPNPAEILCSARMKTFLEEIGERYDMVLVDSPPVISVADPLIITQYMDGVILVVNSGVTDRETAIAAKQQLDKVNSRILGVVLNKVRQKSEDDYYYYYGTGDDGIHKNAKDNGGKYEHTHI
jgi:protein-tyrosine kinase